MTAENESTFDVHDFQRQVIDEFRANAGRVGGMFDGADLVLLTTVGARSGVRRTNPLGYLDINGTPLVVASAGGAPRHPGWYHNIRRTPVVTVERGAETFEAVARILEGAERDELFAEVVQREPGFADYQEKAARQLPVVTWQRINAGAGWTRGMGDFLVEAHDWLRAELAALRDRLDDDAGADLGAQLRAHCREFCSALTGHHTGEDGGAFPLLAQRFPALTPVLAVLAEEHREVDRMQTELGELVRGYRPGRSDPDAVRAELDRLAAELEAHFRYEEQTIIAALNSLGPAPDIG